MSHRVILIVLDGLNHLVGHHAMGYLNALCEAGRGRYYTLSCELPAMSRPLYECLLTGDRPVDSGVVNNDVVRRSHGTSCLTWLAGKASARRRGLSLGKRALPRGALRPHAAPVSASAGCRHPGRAFLLAGSLSGRPSIQRCEMLRQLNDPDFLLVHSMNIDDAGHRHGEIRPSIAMRHVVPILPCPITCRAGWRQAIK